MTTQKFAIVDDNGNTPITLSDGTVLDEASATTPEWHTDSATASRFADTLT